MRTDPCFRQALDIERVPSAPRLRLRLESHAEALRERVDVALVEFLRAAQVPVTPLRTGHVSLDLEVFPLHNSGTKQEGVGRTYAGSHGYAPIAGYLGEEGWGEEGWGEEGWGEEGWGEEGGCLACALRPGTQHRQREFV